MCPFLCIRRSNANSFGHNDAQPGTHKELAAIHGKIARLCSLVRTTCCHVTQNYLRLVLEYIWYVCLFLIKERLLQVSLFVSCIHVCSEGGSVNGSTSVSEAESSGSNPGLPVSPMLTQLAVLTTIYYIWLSQVDLFCIDDKICRRNQYQTTIRRNFDRCDQIESVNPYLTDHSTRK